MAASSKERLVHFRTRLEELECPYLDGVEDSWIEELLFKPGEARLRLLQWILGKFDPVIYQLLENQHSKVLGKNDSRLQKMLFSCHLLGLCKSDDIELIQGTKSRTKQAVFIENLLDLASVVDSAGQIQNSTVPFITSSATGPDCLEDQFKHDCHFFDALCRQEDLRDIFRSKIQLYPPDLMKSASGYEQTRIPDEKHLISVTEKLTNELEEQSKQLEELRTNVPLCDADSSTVEKVSKTLSLSLTTMSQVVSGFLHCFETEMKPWCRRPKPVLSEVGPAFSRVHSLLLKYTKLLQCLATIQSSYNQICQETRSKLARKQESQIGPLNHNELHKLQGCITVLENSLQRLNGEEE